MGQSESFPLQSDTTNARAQKSFETFLIAGQTPGLGFEHDGSVAENTTEQVN
jgi:hypothetical protein